MPSDGPSLRTDHSAAPRSTPPGADGTRPVTIAAPYCDRPSVPSAEPDTGADQGGTASGRGAWGFCVVCGQVLGRRTAVFRQKYCSPVCRDAAEVMRTARLCPICEMPIKSKNNRTCSPACGKLWRLRIGLVHPPDFADRVRALLAAGLSQPEIAARLKVSKSAIAGYRKRNQIPMVAPPPPDAPAAEKKPARPVLIVQPEGADRKQPGRYCSAHPEIRWHPRDYHCRAAAA